jgi:hypothetical protein
MVAAVAIGYTNRFLGDFAFETRTWRVKLVCTYAVGRWAAFGRAVFGAS